MRLRYLLPLAFACIASSAHAGIETAREAYERKDYTAALGEFHALANRGSTEAMSILSIMYLNGEGVPRDTQKAIDYATKSYEKGEDQGLSLLGVIYLSPKSGVRDKEKGLQFLRNGVEKGEFNSLMHFADLLVQGVEVPQDYENAFKYYEKAARRYDSILAAQHLGMMYELGMGRPADEEKALKWYESAKKITIRRIPAEVASISVREAAIKVRHPRRPRDVTDAVALYEAAVKAGNGEAMQRLGKLYETGLGVPQNYRTAAVLYERGANAGDLVSVYSGGLLFEKGLGVDQSDGEAMTWFREAADKGLAVARRRVGRAYDEGRTVAIDHAAAASWYCQAVFSEAETIANPALRIRDIDPLPEQPLAEQLAILDQCAPGEDWQQKVRETRAILSRQLTPAIQLEADRLSKLMKASNAISKVLSGKS